MPPVPRRWLWRGLLAAVVVVVIAGVAVALVLAHAPGNVSHPDLQFTAPTTSTAPAPKPHAKKEVNNFQWPLYGFSGGRTRFFDAPGNLAPPLHVGWKFTDGALLEFPPVIYHETMFVLDDDCAARAINLKNGHVRWFRKIGTLCAASPATAPKAGKAGLVVMPVMSIAGHSPGNGRFVALSMKTGHIVWSRPAGPGSESSPLVHGITVYYGDGGGTLYARNVANGHLYWTYHASGAIKGGPALSGGNLYFGDYAGRAYAVNSVSGHQVWAVGTSGTQFGFGSGNFYATPAVAFGRVYMGNTDGRVYSFGARNGALAWATGTGAYVYASAAVADPKGLGPTVYVGSYDGNLYAFNAQSGAVRWKHQVGGRISGSSTVIGNVVYFSNLGNKSTVGLDAVSGRTVFSFGDGAFTPIIADYHALYLDGYAVIYQLLPGRRPHHRAARHHARAKHKRAAHHAARHAKAKKHAAHRATKKAKTHAKVKKKHAARKVRHAAKKKANNKPKK